MLKYAQVIWQYMSKQVPGYYQSANGLMVTHPLGHMIVDTGLCTLSSLIYIYIYREREIDR